MGRMAEPQTSHLLLESPLARVYDVVCRTPRSGYGARMFNADTEIGLPRRGVFVIERRGESAVIDTNTALMLGPDDEYRVAHPTGGGDEGTVLALPPDLVEPLLLGPAQEFARHWLAGRATTSPARAEAVLAAAAWHALTTAAQEAP